MTQTAASTATNGSPPDPLVAGLDLLSASERDADRVAHAVAAELKSRQATEVTVATHWAEVDELRHVALTIEASGLDVGALGDVLALICGSELGEAEGPAARSRSIGGTYTGPPELQDAVEAAVGAHRTRSSGRVVVFPGSAGLVGTLSIGEVLATSAIDRVRVLAGGEAGSETPVVTRDFVRARWAGGELLLDTQPAIGGTLVPFETPFPTPCCAYHS